MKVNIKNKDYELDLRKKTNNVFEISLNYNGNLASKISFAYEVINERKRIWLYKIETTNHFRKFGLGSKLMQTMEYIAFKNKVYNIDGYYYPDDYIVASMFYYKNGYKFNYENGATYIYKELSKEPENNEIISIIMENDKKSVFEH